MGTETREALTAAQAGALVQKRIDPLLLEYVRRYSPLIYTIPARPWDSTTYWFNQRTTLPAGGPVTDGGARTVSTSTYLQNNFVIKLFQQQGAVTGYAEAVTRGLVGSLKALEIKGATQGATWDLETWICWGNALATFNGAQPGPDGWDTLVSTFSGTNQNAMDKAHGAFALNYLDELIDLVEENVAAPVDGGDYMLVMSPKANSRIAQILTNQQRFLSVEVAAGLVVPTYRNVPIVKSSFLSARSQQANAVTAAPATTGGTLAAATYYYYVSAVLSRFGEVGVQAAETSQVTTGATSTVSLTVSAPTGPDGAVPMLYKVYRSTATGTETLLGIVDAFDTTGATTTTIIDTGTNLLTNSAANTGPTAYVGTNAGVGPRTTNDEDIYLVPKSEDFMVRPYVRDLFVKELAATQSSPDALPFAVMTDTTLALRAPKYAGRIARTSVAAL